MAFVEPFGQAELRGVLLEALSGEAGTEVGPSVDRNSSARVFQYLGNVRRPAQIALLDETGRVGYDFRQGRVLLAGTSDWSRPRLAGGSAHSSYLDLVRRWERLLGDRKN